MLWPWRYWYACWWHWCWEVVECFRNGRLTRRCGCGRIMRRFLFGLLPFAWRSGRRARRLVFELPRLARLPLLGLAIINGLAVGAYFFLLALPLRLVRRSAICFGSCIAVLCMCSFTCSNGRLSGSCRSRICNTFTRKSGVGKGRTSNSNCVGKVVRLWGDWRR